MLFVEAAARKLSNWHSTKMLLSSAPKTPYDKNRGAKPEEHVTNL